MTPTEELQDQIEFLLDQLRKKEVNLHQFMVLLDMAYQDFLELNPEEHPYYIDKKRIQEKEKQVNRKHKLEI